MPKCKFCYEESHSTKKCPVETALSKIIKVKVGNLMEHYVKDYVNCPKCNSKLHLLSNNSPSLDLICNNCNSNFEVKSKCLSAKILPDDLIIYHGNYNFYKSRQNDGLDFIIIIYKVDRFNKEIKIRKVFYVPHHIIVNNCDFIVKKNDSNSIVYIKNHNKFNNISDSLLLRCNLSAFINHEIQKFKKLKT